MRKQQYAVRDASPASYCNSLIYSLNAARFTHLLGGIVGAETSTIPVALKRRWMEGDLETPLLCDADKD
jgi:hypothetical protein